MDLCLSGSITVDGLVDGVDVSAHASRHIDAGADEITSPLDIGAMNPAVARLLYYWQSGVLCLWIPFYEETGATCADVGKYGNNGTITEAAWVAGKIGYALSFDGVNDYVLGSTSPNSLTAMTVAAWVKPDVVDNWKQASVVTKFEAGKYQWKIGLTDTGGGRFDVYESQTSYRSAIGGLFTVGVWAHMAGTFDGRFVKIYVNGAYQGLGGFPAPTTIQDVAASLRVGCEPVGSRYFDGVIDEVMIFNKVLSADEIKALYKITNV